MMHPKKYQKRHSLTKDVSIFMILFMMMLLAYCFGFSELHGYIYGSSGQKNGSFIEQLAYMFLNKWQLFAIPTLPLLLVCLVKITLLRHKPYSKGMVVGLVILYGVLVAMSLGYWLIQRVGAAYAKPF